MKDQQNDAANLQRSALLPKETRNLFQVIMWLFTVVILHVMILQNGSFSVQEANRQCTQMIRGVFRDVNSQEISFPGLEALISGLVRVSVWTVVIRLAKQWQQVRRGSVACWWIRRPRHRRRPRRRQRVTTLTAVVPDRCGERYSMVFSLFMFNFRHFFR